MPQPRVRKKWAEIGERLRESREWLGLSQQFVADQVGMPRPSITWSESGRRAVTVEELEKFAQLYRRPIQWLATGTYPEDIKVVIPPRMVEQMEHLAENDREQVMRFVEFLACAGKPPRVK